MYEAARLAQFFTGSSSHQHIWLQTITFKPISKSKLKSIKKGNDKQSINELTTDFNLAMAQQKESLCENWVQVNAVNQRGHKKKVNNIHVNKEDINQSLLIIHMPIINGNSIEAGNRETTHSKANYNPWEIAIR